MNVRTMTAAIAFAVLISGAAAGCSGDDSAAPASTAADATTDAPTTSDAPGTESTTSTTQIEADRAAPAVTSLGQALDPAVCASLFAAIQAITLPAEGTDGWGAQLDASLAAIDAAAAAAGGYPAEQLAILRAALDEARPAITDGGFAGWQDTIIASREGPEEADIEVQLESLRAYVLPRC